MAVVGIGKVRVAVRHRCVRMSVGVAFAGRRTGRVGMLVVGIVDVLVGVFSRLVCVQVAVLLGQVQPHAQRHQRAGDQQRHRYRLVDHQHAQQCTEERRDGKVRPGARRAELAQRPPRGGG